jgi:hypothetical protein
VQTILQGDSLDKEYPSELNATENPIAPQEQPAIDPSIEEQLDLLAEIIVSRLLRELSNDTNE